MKKIKSMEGNTPHSSLVEISDNVLHVNSL